MREAIIADRKPRAVTLAKRETYAWCACGRSKSQPSCDGSHTGTGLEPLSFEAKEDGEAHLCLCKRTGSAPFCDGSHAKLPKEDAAGPATGTVPSPRKAAGTPEEPTVGRIHELARSGLEKVGHHGEMVAMGVPATTLPQWSDIQLLTAQFARKPLPDDAPVGSELVIGPNARKPLVLDIPLFVSGSSPATSPPGRRRWRSCRASRSPGSAPDSLRSMIPPISD